jgi:hypothetical protein
MLSSNPNAIHILEQNLDKIFWNRLSLNPNAIHLLEQNIDKIDWSWLSVNPNAIHLLEQNIDKIDWSWLSVNPNAIHLLSKLDVILMRENCKSFAEELTAYVFHPLRLINISNSYGIELEEYIEYLI